jgi:hypothetical protein
MVYYLKRKSTGEMGKAFKYRLKQLPLYYKLTGIGSLLSLIAIFLPWLSYDAIVWNGFQGITYPIGYIIVFLSFLVFIFFLFHWFDKKIPKFPFKEYTFNIVAGGEIVLLCIITILIYNAIYFFTSKSNIELGVSISALGGLLISIGGYLAWKEERQDNVKKTFIHMPEQEPDKDLERYLKKSKDEHKMLSVEESMGEERARTEEPVKEDQQPPNLKMFE